MAKFMLVLGGAEKNPERLPLSYEEISQKYMEWTKSMIGMNALVLAHKLKDGEGHRFRWKDDVVVDGPFTESKETVGGVYIIDVPDYETAVALARQCPTVLYQRGFAEVRAIEI